MIQIEEDKLREVISRIRELENYLTEQIIKDNHPASALEWNLLLSNIDQKTKVIAKLLGRKYESDKNRINQEVPRV